MTALCCMSYISGVSAVRVEHHPRFADQYTQMARLAAASEEQMDLFSEVTALLGALEEFGHDLERGRGSRDADG